MADVLGILDNNIYADAEVMYINSYAKFMGYVSMAIKGLGFLVLTWTTVVLLGGFVSTLQKKDFWCLTFITLVQITGLQTLNVVLDENFKSIVKAVIGLSAAIISGVLGNPASPLVARARIVLACVLMLVQVLVLATVLCPLAIVYLFGIFMSGVISLWRLIEHDYVGGESANLEPALDTLYYLSLLQGVLFCYRLILARAGISLAREEAPNNCTDSELEVLCNYLHETITGCENDPSFVKGRSLITDAIEKIGSSLPVESNSGVKILYTAICIVETNLKGPHYSWTKGPDACANISAWQRMLMKHLVSSTSSSRHILQKLLETLDSRGLHRRESRNHAAKIVERIAFSIKLEQFPRGIQHISSLIGTFEEYSISEPCQVDLVFDIDEGLVRQLKDGSELPSPAGEVGMGYKELLLRGMCILRKLAVDENNCRVMSDTPGLVSKIMAPVTCDLLHHTTDDHGAWSDVVERSMDVMCKLTDAPGETGVKLRREISRCDEAISTMESILSCTKCKEDLQQRAISILTQLHMHTNESSRSADFAILEKQSSSSSSSSSSREDFVRMLMDIFMSGTKYSSSIRGYAGVSLSEICFLGGISDATAVIQSSVDVDSLTVVLLNDKDEICRLAAAGILEHLSTHYTKDDEYLGKLKKAILEVIEEILGCGDETHNGTDDSAKQKPEKENQCDNRQGKGNRSSLPSHPKNPEDKVIGEIFCHLEETRIGKDEPAKQKPYIENQFDNGRAKVTSSSSPSHPQIAEEKVIGEILCCRDETRNGRDESAKQKPNIENQCDNGRSKGISSSPRSDRQNTKEKVIGEKPCKETDQGEFAQQKIVIENHGDCTEEYVEQDKDEKKFHEAAKSIRSANLLSSLLSLCGAVYDTMSISDLAPQSDSSIFLNKLKELVVKKSDHPTVENLLVCKATGKMVISMMKHSSGMFVEQEELRSLRAALSSASKNMMNLDNSMVFSCDSSLMATTLPKLNKRTLASIVKEAIELHAMVPSTSASG